jgi:hypothetical protein
MNNNQRSKRTQAQQPQQRQRQPAAAVASGRSGSTACPSLLDRNSLAKTEQAGAWPCPKN